MSLTGLPSGVCLIIQYIAGRATNTTRRRKTTIIPKSMKASLVDRSYATLANLKILVRKVLNKSLTTAAESPSLPISEFKILSSLRRQEMTGNGVKECVVVARISCSLSLPFRPQ